LFFSALILALRDLPAARILAMPVAEIGRFDKTLPRVPEKICIAILKNRDVPLAMTRIWRTVYSSQTIDLQPASVRTTLSVRKYHVLSVDHQDQS
jgi:hypothetical protein